MSTVHQRAVNDRDIQERQEHQQRLIESSRLTDQYGRPDGAEHNEESEDDEDVDVCVFHADVVVDQHVLTIERSLSLTRLIQHVELSQEH